MDRDGAPHTTGGEVLMPLITRNHPHLTLEGAQAVLDTALARAREINVPMIIAVVDHAGFLLAFARMDGAKPSSVQVALNKAECSAIRRQPTGAAQVEGETSTLLSLALAIGSHSRQTPIRGGLPLMVDGQCVGGIGVSNGTEDQDVDVARSAAAVLERA